MSTRQSACQDSESSALSSTPTAIDSNAALARAQRDGRQPRPSTLLHHALPNEALLLVFQFLHEQDMQLIQPCMRVCRAWRRLILNESRFWHVLQIDLDYPDEAVQKAVYYTSRCFRHRSGSSPLSTTPPSSTIAASTPKTLQEPHPKTNAPVATSLLDLTISSSKRPLPLTYKGGRNAFNLRCAAALSDIMEKVRPHLSELRSLEVRITGDGQHHIRILDDILLPLVTFHDPASPNQANLKTRLSTVKYVQLVLPCMHSLPLAFNSLAFFETSEIVTIRGNWPFSSKVIYPPEEPETPPQAVRRVLDHQARGLDVSHMVNRELYKQYQKHQEAVKHYQADLASHNAYWKLEELDWQSFHHPREVYSPSLSYGDSMNVRQCHFTNLTTLNFYGCAIADNLILPAAEFTSLRKLTVIRCKWGIGLWNFLAHTPNLELLDIQYLLWNEVRSSKTAKQQMADSPASTLANDEEMADEASTSSSPSTSSNLTDEETPPYEGPPSPDASETIETNHILNNSTITILGDSNCTIEDFDEEDDEDPDAALVGLIESRVAWCKQEPVYTYPEELCYPPEIDAGCSWAVISKPICEGVWQFEAGFRYCHRVYTHFDDQEYMEEDFMSEYSWHELQRHRAAARRQQDLADGVDDWDDDSAIGQGNIDTTRNNSRRPQPKDQPEQITLPRLQSLNFIGGTYQPIWASTSSKHDKSVHHPALSMPNLRQVSLSGDRSLESTRLSKPVAAFHREALSYTEVKHGQSEIVRLPSKVWEELITEFEDGKEPVPNEATDEQLLASMSEDNAAYYMNRPERIPEYRRGWRKRQGLLAKDGRADERAVLALITGAMIANSPPFTGPALLATSPLVTCLDLSNTIISPIVFQSMMKQVQQLRELSLAGVRTLRDKDLEIVPKFCPLLVSLDISHCGACLTPAGAVIVVDKMRQSTRNVNRLSRVKVDDPSQLPWPPNLQSNKHHYLSLYRYLDFIGVLVDEEIETWQDSLRHGWPFSKKPGKHHQKLA